VASGAVSVLLLVICMAILPFDSLQNPMDRLPRRLAHPGVPARRPLSIRYPPEPIETPLEQKSRPLLRIEANWSRRKIFLSRKCVEALRRHRERQATEKEALGDRWHDDDLVFCSVVGTPLSRHNLGSRSFKPLLRRANLPNIRFHELRHTCATLLLSKNVHPKLVQELLGHASISTTLDTYSHVLCGMSRVVADTMDNILP
jgi:integrase